VTTQRPNAGFYGWTNAWLLFFIYMASAGLVFWGYAVIFPVMIQATGWSRGDASIANSINMLLIGLLVPVAAVIINKIGTKKSIIAGLIILLSALFLLGTVTTKLWHWTLIWGLLMPIGIILSGILPVQINVMFWFNMKRATVLGLVMTGGPAGGFIAQPVYTWFMEHTHSWQTGWLLSGGVTALAIVLSFWVRSKPDDIGQYPDGLSPDEAREAEEDRKKTARTYRTPEAWAIRDVLKTPTIWFIIVVGITHMLPVILITSHGVLHIKDLGYTQMQAALVLMVLILASGIARFPTGWLGDRIEPRWIISGAMVLLLVAFAGIWQAPSFFALLVFGPIFGIGFGTLLVMMATLLGNYYGPESYANIGAVTAPFYVIVGAAVPTVAGYIADNMGSYTIAFVILLAGLVIGVVCSAFLAPPKWRENFTTD